MIATRRDCRRAGSRWPAAFVTVPGKFNTHRMVGQYVDAYLG